MLLSKFGNMSWEVTDNFTNYERDYLLRVIQPFVDAFTGRVDPDNYNDLFK